MSRPTTRCFWCGKDKTRFSGWEQEHYEKGWQRLCNPCATRRINNPWNALLSMRKIEGGPR